MRTDIKSLTSLLAGATLLAGCATQHSVKRLDLKLNAERSDRVAADSALAQQLGAVRGDVTQLRSDLATMRNEFGARISAVEQGIKFDMPVNFAFNDANVRPEDQPLLDRFAAVSQKYYPGARITLEGFADPAGSARYNVQLSQRRADAVRSYLTGKGIPDTALKTIGYGKSRLIVPNASHDQPGAEQNRRVVFVIETRGDTTAARPNVTASAPSTGAAMGATTSSSNGDVTTSTDSARVVRPDSSAATRPDSSRATPQKP